MLSRRVTMWERTPLICTYAFYVCFGAEIKLDPNAYVAESVRRAVALVREEHGAHAGWVVDGAPLSPQHATEMLREGVLGDCTVVLQVSTAQRMYMFHHYADLIVVPFHALRCVSTKTPL